MGFHWERGAGALLVALLIGGTIESPRKLAPWDAAGPVRGAGDRPVPWPAGTVSLDFEKLEGLVLVRARLQGMEGQDTTGLFVLDTGAGFLALDRDLAVLLRVADHSPLGSAVGIAERPLPRLDLGGLTMDQVKPVLTFEADHVRRAIDRPVLGLLGQRPIQDRIVWIDYSRGEVALIPAGPRAEGTRERAIEESRRLLGGALSPRAIPLRFRLAKDGKALIDARFQGPKGGAISSWLTLAIDTGASKCFLFEKAADSLAGGLTTWEPSLRGLVAPTLEGADRARLTRARRLEVGDGSRTAAVPETDVALLSGTMADRIAGAGETPVHGLLGYSFLKRFRVACDYPHRVLWLDPIPGYREPRPFEHSHVGIQVERHGREIRIAAVVEGSPAARAGIEAGDEIVSLDGSPVSGLDLVQVVRRMEGRPGTALILTVRRGRPGQDEETYRLRRRQLL